MDINTLFEGQDLSDEFKEKVTAVLEAAVADQVEAKTAELQESYDTRLKEAIESEIATLETQTESYIQEEILPTIDRYLSESVKQFVAENKERTEDALKVQLAESFLEGFGKLAEQHNVKVPEGSLDVVESAKAELQAAKEKANSEFELRLEAEAVVESLKRGVITSQVVTGLAESQAEKIVSLAEKVSYKSDEQFKEALVSLKESYFPVEGKETAPINEKEESLNESVKDSYLESLLSSIV